jgi:hypothetical protein
MGKIKLAHVGFFTTISADVFSFNPLASPEVLCKEYINILPAESTVTPRADAVGFEYPSVVPPPHRINMHIKKPRQLPRRQHTICLINTCHANKTP